MCNQPIPALNLFFGLTPLERFFYELKVSNERNSKNDKKEDRRDCPCRSASSCEAYQRLYPIDKKCVLGLDGFDEAWEALLDDD